ncbi:MAG: hypothetical protein Q9159_007149 [Coniocarpon cinnabarinum]
MATAEASATALPRRDLRSATIVVPETGQRVRRSVTLRDPKVFTPSNPSGQPNGQHGNDSNGTAIQTPQKPLTPPPWTRQVLDAIKASPQTLGHFLWEFITGRDGQSVLKCSVAYLIGTMAVFVPFFRNGFFLGPGDGKHLVANITIWFHPARSTGSMHYGTFLAFVFWLFSVAVAFSCMAIVVFFDNQELIEIGQAIILIIGCGFGLGFLVWIKQRINDPLVNVSCTIAALPIVSVVTKDPATQQGFFSSASVTSVLYMLILAIIITSLVNAFVRPVYARFDLRDNLVKATTAYATILAGITSSFLSGTEEDLKHQAVKDAEDAFDKAYNALDANLTEARWEQYLVGNERRWEIEQRLVRCLRRLAQDIGGLRSAASIQFSLLAESAKKGEHLAHLDPQNSYGMPGKTPILIRDFANQTADEYPFSSPEVSSPTSPSEATSPPVQSQQITVAQRRTSITKPEGPWAAAADHVFATFIEALGPPMKSLAFTLNTILHDLPMATQKDRQYAGSAHPAFRPSLADAIKLFNQARKDALETVYKSKEITQAKSVAVAADFEEVAASCGHFSSSLQDLAEGVLAYIDAVNELEQDVHRRSPRSWNWIFHWRRVPGIRLPDDHENARPSMMEHQDIDFPMDMPSLTTRRYYNYTTGDDELSSQRTLRYQAWRSFRIFRRDDVKFAIKVGFGAFLISALAYIPATRPTFHAWRFEWALATYMFVCAMTTGAANSSVFPRIRGTFYGAAIAITVWYIAGGNVYLLAFFCWLMSVWCFYLMFPLNQGPMGRFMLLTFNLSVLYSYSISINDTSRGNRDRDEGGANPKIWLIVGHRLVAVTLGIVFGLFITQSIWPLSARKKLKAGLSVLWLRMSLIWKRAPSSSLLDEGPLGPPKYMDIREETKLREFRDFLNTLRTAAESEFRLRGPFPTEIYDDLLKSTGRMLDGFHALSVVLQKDVKATQGEAAILRFTSNEREKLAKRISHLFTVLASSVKLEFPLNDTLPDITNSRDVLLAKMFEFRQDANKSVLATDDDYELFYAYALVTAQIAHEINISSGLLEKLYGTLSEELLKLQ